MASTEYDRIDVTLGMTVSLGPGTYEFVKFDIKTGKALTATDDFSSIFETIYSDLKSLALDKYQEIKQKR